MNGVNKIRRGTAVARYCRCGHSTDMSTNDILVIWEVRRLPATARLSTIRFAPLRPLRRNKYRQEIV